MIRALTLIMVLIPSLAQAQEVDGSLTYQGRVKRNGQLINGTCEIHYTLFNAARGGEMVGATIERTETLREGLFTSEPLDFGDVLDGTQRLWLEAQLHCAGDIGFTALEPRQQLTAAPFAAYALSTKAGHTLDRAGGGTAAAVVVDNLGRVGINEAAPTDVLQISHLNPVIKLKSNTTGTQHTAFVRMTDANDDETGRIGFASSTATDLMILNSMTAGGIALHTRDLERLTVAPHGAVGIGTTDPEALLEVVGSRPVLLDVTGQNASDTMIRMTSDKPGGRSFDLRVGRARFDVADALTGATPLAIESGDNHHALRIDGSGKVGIGTTAPLSLLHVVPRGGDPACTLESSDHQLLLRYRDERHEDRFGRLPTFSLTVSDADGQAAAGALHVQRRSGGGTFEANLATFSANGNLLIGDVADLGEQAERLHVAGSIRATGMIDGTSCCASDARFKTEVAAITSALDILGRLRGVTFSWNRAAFANRDFPAGRHSGFIAQEVETVMPEAVVRHADGYRAVIYDRVIPVLVEGVKELEAAGDVKDAHIARQDATITELNSRVQALEAIVAKLAAAQEQRP